MPDVWQSGPVKATLDLPDDPYLEVTATAAMLGRSITSIVEHSLRAFLNQHAVPEQLPPLPEAKSAGGFTDEFIATGIDFNNTAEVLAWLDEVEGRNP